MQNHSTYGTSYKEYRKKEKQSKATNTSSNKEVNRVEGRELEEGQTFQY